jgi:SAM-dependent methyltransferase
MNLGAEASWEKDVYSIGRQLNRYPFDAVVAFVWRYRPPKPVAETRLLELGCGAGNNLWFAAREGFAVAGIDISQTAIDYARRRFAEDGLVGDFRVGEFTSLPFDDESFDLAIDRGAITCVSLEQGRRAVSEIWRVLKPGGRFFFNPFSDRHTAGHDAPLVYHYGRHDLDTAISDFELLRRDHVTIEADDGLTQAEWRVVCERPTTIGPGEPQDDR